LLPVSSIVDHAPRHLSLVADTENLPRRKPV
jgi:hypothetical protein